MIDNELFELCKEVYKRFPEWNDTQNGYYFVDGREPLLYDNDVFAVEEDDQWWGQMAFLAPQYTSDYLLEKLAQTDGMPIVFFGHDHGQTNTPRAWFAHKDVSGTLHTEDSGEGADTPLKALLKLTIALDNAGQLKGEK